MKKVLGIILAGAIAGSVNGLLGAGGGMLLVPLLTKWIQDENKVFPTSVAIIFPISFVSLVICPGLNKLPWLHALPYLIAAVPGAMIAGWIDKKIPVKWLHRGLGILIFMGWFEISVLIDLVVGLILGFLSGLGIGGGSLLILWLTLVANIPPETARTINLMFFLAAAGSVSILRLKTGSLDKCSLLPAIISGCIAAGICSWVGTLLDPDILKKVFGCLLIFTGIRELFYRPRKAK